MLVTWYLMSTIWLAAANLCVCQASQSEVHIQKRSSQAIDESTLPSKDNIKQNTFHKHTTFSNSHSPHHHPRHIHSHSNTSHSHTFKSHSLPSHSSDENELNELDQGTHLTRLAAKGAATSKADEEGPEEVSNEKEEKRRRRSEERKMRRKKHEDLTWQNDVDDVLAALVGYSRDPTLWRFVHSVVAELDYSKHASNSSPPLGSRRSQHKTEPHFATWTPRRDGRKGKHGHHGTQIHSSETFDSGGIKEDYGGGEGGGGGGEKESGRGSEVEKHINGSETNKVTFNKEANGSQQVYFPSQNQPIINRFAVLNPHNQDYTKGTVDTSSDVTSSLATPTAFVARPTHPPHFIFHKVYIDTNYDPHTRQPYHRPVLAVKAVSWDKAKDTLSNKENTDGFSDVLETETYHMARDGSTDLPDKLDEILIRHTHSSDLKVEKDETSDSANGQKFDTDEKNSIFEPNRSEDLMETEDQEQKESHDGHGWREITPWHHHQRHFIHRLRQLHSFKSQMRFLRRWQERLIRKRHQWSSYYLPTMT